MSEKVSFKWGKEEDEAFRTLRDSLCSAPVLAYPDFSRPFILQTDASKVAIGAVLAQKLDDGLEHPVAYISRSLTKSECNYDTREQEALAIVWACRKLRCYLGVGHFDVFTDHKNLKWLMQ